jgi:hypothetical protein
MQPGPPGSAGLRVKDADLMFPTEDSNHVLALVRGLPRDWAGRDKRQPDLENVSAADSKVLTGILGQDHIDGPHGQAGADDPGRCDIPRGQRLVTDRCAEKSQSKPAQLGLDGNALRRFPGYGVKELIDGGRRWHDSSGPQFCHELRPRLRPALPGWPYPHCFNGVIDPPAHHGR